MGRKILLAICSLFLITGLITAEENAKGLEKTPVKLAQALPQVQPNGIITSSKGAPGDGKEPSELPSRVDLSEYLPPIESQGSIGSCSAWSTIYYGKTLQENMERGWGADDPGEIFSPLFTYNQITNGVNRGTAIVDHMAIVVDQGCATLETFPEKYDLTVRPDSISQNEASQYKAESYESLSNYNYDTEEYIVDLQQVKTILAAGYPVIVGFTLNESFDDYKGGVYSKIYGAETGGHAMCIIGYDDSINALLLVNSWGTWWGEDGYLKISYDIFQTLAQWGAGVLYDHTANTYKKANPPSNLQASQGSLIDSIKLTWSEVEDSKEYVVYRSNNSEASLEEIARVESPEYIDGPLPENVTYIYAVTSVNKSRKESSFSPITEGYTGEAELEEDDLPGIPSGLEKQYNGQIALLDWDTVENASSYRIYRWSGKEEEWLSYADSSDSIYLDIAIRAWDDEPTVYYIVTAIGENGQEGYPSESLYFPLGSPSKGSFIPQSKAPSPSKKSYSGEFKKTEYFDYKYTMKQFKDFYKAEQEAFKNWKAKEKDDFEAFKEKEMQGFSKRK